MSKLFRDWYETVDKDSHENKDFIKQREDDEWAYNNMQKIMKMFEGGEKNES